ncbi:hypothetical protein APUTEX25_002520, partial [Auxenochlorella protothecoides]
MSGLPQSSLYQPQNDDQHSQEASLIQLRSQLHELDKDECVAGCTVTLDVREAAVHLHLGAMPEITIEEVEGDAAQAVDLLSDSHWRDLAPLPYPPLPQPVVEIDMDEETALLMGRFWAVKTAG